ncbi:MAG: antitoxin [Candidatus Bathyarchaeia archaeon]
MSDVIALRVSKKLKKELQELDLDYAEDIRAYLERIVKREKLKRKMEEVEKFRKELGKKTGLTTPAADIIRRDREHAH